MMVSRRSETAATRYNLIRLIRLLSVLWLPFNHFFSLQELVCCCCFIGIISLVLGFALQTPSSFIGWLYILIRAPYKVGDRIR
jgi:hypothetical protein